MLYLQTDFLAEPKGFVGRSIEIDLRLSRLHSLHARKGMNIQKPRVRKHGVFVLESYEILDNGIQPD